MHVWKAPPIVYHANDGNGAPPKKRHVVAPPGIVSSGMYARATILIFLALPLSANARQDLWLMKGHDVRRTGQSHNQYTWDGRDSSGHSVGSGIYVIRAITRRPGGVSVRTRQIARLSSADASR